jgi:HAUS augmin-like complex subunit 4
MVKGLHSQNLPSDVAQVVDQLEHHCLAPDGSFISKPLFNDLQLVLLSLSKLCFLGVC